MSVSLRAFKIGLYEEHLEEIAFLHDQCVVLRADPARPWQDPASFEARLEAHLDALVVGGALALDVGRARAAQAEPGELFGIAALWCRVEAADPLRKLLEAPPIDDEQARALEQALLLEWPSGWMTPGLRLLAQGDTRLAPIFAGVAGTRGWPARDGLQRALARATDHTVLARLLGCVGASGDSGAPVTAWYEHPDDAVRHAALAAGLRMHDAEARRLALRPDAEPLLHALAGGRQSVNALLDRVNGAQTQPSVLSALGQLGDLRAVRVLLDVLPHAPLAGAAALALHLMTGADMREQALVPEAVNEDELFDAERQRWRERGEVPRRADGQPFGERVDRIPQAPEAWSQWLAEHRSQFQAALRYRLGEPCSPAVSLRSLAAGALPAFCRTSLADDLAARYGVRGGWLPALTVARQWSALRSMAGATQTSPGEAGRWHWAGNALAD